jgi:hypothetical protein
MKRVPALFTVLFLGLLPALCWGQTDDGPGQEARVYLTDGTVVQGRLLQRADDLIIVRVDSEVYTFEPDQVRNIVTLNSLGGAAETRTSLEFPYVSFLGGTAAFGLLSWLQFDRAGNKRDDADINQASGLPDRATKLRDEADTAELLGWSAAVLAAGSLGVALIPRRTEERVFPALSLSNGTAFVQLACRF